MSKKKKQYKVKELKDNQYELTVVVDGKEVKYIAGSDPKGSDSLESEDAYEAGMQSLLDSIGKI
jgi:hypothetical protein